MRTRTPSSDRPTCDITSSSSLRLRAAGTARRTIARRLVRRDYPDLPDLPVRALVAWQSRRPSVRLRGCESQLALLPVLTVTPETRRLEQRPDIPDVSDALFVGRVGSLLRSSLLMSHLSAALADDTKKN